jgi:hypothetical protein
MVRHAVRNWVRWKELYDIIGLNAVAETIVILKRIAGIKPATPPDPDFAPDAINPDASYPPTTLKFRDGDYSSLSKTNRVGFSFPSNGVISACGKC